VERFNSRHSSKQRKKNGSKRSRNDESTQERGGKKKNAKNTSRPQRVILPPNPGGHKEDSGPRFPLEILVFTQITRISGPLSHKHLRGGKTLTKDERKYKWRR
jgi:hypothetical protein